MTEIAPDRGDDAHAVGDRFDVVDAEDVRPRDEAADEAGNRPGIALGRGSDAEDLTDDRLARDGEEEGQVVVMESFELTVDREIVGALLREIDPRVEDDLVVAQPDRSGAGEAVVEEGLHRLPDVVVVLTGVRDLRLAHRMHDEERGIELETEPSIRVIDESADVVDDVDSPGFEDCLDDLGSPGVD